MDKASEITAISEDKEDIRKEVIWADSEGPVYTIMHYIRDGVETGIMLKRRPPKKGTVPVGSELYGRAFPRGNGMWEARGDFTDCHSPIADTQMHDVGSDNPRDAAEYFEKKYPRE